MPRAQSNQIYPLSIPRSNQLSSGSYVSPQASDEIVGPVDWASSGSMFNVPIEDVLSQWSASPQSSDTASTIESSDENIANANRLDQYKHYTQKFLQLVVDSDLEFGLDSALDFFMRERLAENSLATKEWLNSIFIEHFHDVTVVTGILRTIAHLHYDDIAPQGPTMSLAALAHDHPEVRECGIRAFENWATLESLEVLKNVRCQEKWLQDYVDQVVGDLLEEFEVNVITH